MKNREGRKLYEKKNRFLDSLTVCGMSAIGLLYVGLSVLIHASNLNVPIPNSQYPLFYRNVNFYVWIDRLKIFDELLFSNRRNQYI